MRAINAVQFSSADNTQYLNGGHACSRFDTASIKRGDRRKQRHALRAELAGLVATSLEQNRLAKADCERDARRNSKVVPGVRLSAVPTVLFPAQPATTTRTVPVTVIHKKRSLFERPDVEHLRIAA